MAAGDTNVGFRPIGKISALLCQAAVETIERSSDAASAKRTSASARFSIGGSSGIAFRHWTSRGAVRAHFGVYTPGESADRPCFVVIQLRR